MPFVNGSGNSDLEYLSDGITETLINSLTQLPSMSVKARSAVFRYKGKDLDPTQAATELNAEAVLNGRVVQRGDTITLSLDLVDGATGNQIWGEQYKRNVRDLVLLQKEIARDVSNSLSSKLSGTDEKNLAKSYTVDPEAYQLYLQGRYQWNRRTPEGITKARDYFQKAIDKDPSYALAYAGLADSYIVIADLLPADAKPKAKAAGLKALELDPSLGEAHAVLGNVAIYYEYDWPTAEREYRRAIELSPSYATAHHWFGETLSAVGRFDESFAEYKRATELDPVSPAISSDLGLAYLNARQFERAEEQLKKLIELDPSFIRSYFYLANVYEQRDRFAESIEVRRVGLLKQEPDAPRVEAEIARLRAALAKSGEAGYWKATLELTVEAARREGVAPNPVDMASLYAQLNDRDNAFEWLEKGYRERWSYLVFLNTDPTWDNLRGDPRFTELIQRVGIPRE
jgi:TolB-like protein/Flp pilus assembly protein TadD